MVKLSCEADPGAHLSGIIPAVVTPFDSEGKFAPVPFQRLLERLYRSGVHGIYVCGTAGEGLVQTVAQRKEVAEAAVECSPPGKWVILHVGAPRIDDAIELVEHASTVGAHAISSLPPHGDYTFADVRTYYQLLASASRLPILIYYLPQVYPAISGLAHILELCEIPRIIGVKFTSADLVAMTALKKHGAIVFNGRDDVLVPALLMGADGGIGSFYNVVPDLFLHVYELAKAARWQEATAVQDRINELIAITARFPVFPAIKTLLRWSGIDCGEFLPPRRPLNAEEESRLRALLSEVGFGDSGVGSNPGD